MNLVCLQVAAAAAAGGSSSGKGGGAAPSSRQQAAAQPPAAQQQQQQSGQQQYLYEGKYGLPVVRRKLGYSELLRAVRMGEVSEVHFFTMEEDASQVSLDGRALSSLRLVCQGCLQLCCRGGAAALLPGRAEHRLPAQPCCSYQVCLRRPAQPCCSQHTAAPVPFLLLSLQMEGPCLVVLTDGTVAQGHIPDHDWRCALLKKCSLVCLVD